MNETAVTENVRGGGCFGVDGKVCQQTAFSIWKGPGDEMESGECNERVAKAAQPVDQDPFCRARHV
jgi:hypothetical protein